MKTKKRYTRNKQTNTLTHFLIHEKIKDAKLTKFHLNLKAKSQKHKHTTLISVRIFICSPIFLPFFKKRTLNLLKK
jgi:hypothetical protein